MMNKDNNQCFYSDDGRVWRSNRDGTLSEVVTPPREVTRREDEEASSRKRSARHATTKTTTGADNTVPKQQQRSRQARPGLADEKAQAPVSVQSSKMRAPPLAAAGATAVAAAAAPNLHPRYPGAVRESSSNYVGDDDATIQIGGEQSIAAVAHMVDTEQEMRLHQEYERTARERDEYRRLFERATVAEVVLAPGQGGNTAFCAEEHVVISSRSHERGETPQDYGPPRRQCNKKWLAIISGTVVLVLLVGIVIGVVVGVRNSSEPKAKFIPPDLIELLSSVSSDGGDALWKSGSPQRQALIWLAGNEHLELYGDEQKIQRYALATCYFSMGGDEWLDKAEWLEDSDECGHLWNGGARTPTLRCTESGALVELDLSDNNLNGEIPPEIGLLSNALEILRLGDGTNALFGTLVTEIGQLTNLVYLRLSHNDLSGPLPTEIWDLRNLGSLTLNTNLFSGSISNELGLLTKLFWLDLCCNRFSGTIPSVLHDMTNLNGTNLYDNQFTGDFVCPEFIAECWISCHPGSGRGDECRSYP